MAKKDKSEQEEDSVLTALDKLLSETEKKYGKGAIMNLEGEIEGIEFVSSGSLSLDEALGGGYPKGRIIEIFGDSSTGKTTLTIHAMVEAQRQGGVVGFIDAEHAFDLMYAQNLGLKISKRKFQISQPSCGEEGLEICEAMVKTGVFDLIIVDSVAALTPRAEIDGEMGEAKMGLHARLMSQAMRKLTSYISKTNTTVIFINQTRVMLGVMFGDNTTTTGGNALKFYASQRVQTYRSGQTKSKEGDEILANGCRCKVVKNKVSFPFKVAKFDIVFGKGIDKLKEVIDLAIEFEIIKRSGSWYAYGEVKLGQGEGKVKDLLNDNPELLEEITEKVKQELKN